ncbi:MAG: hypothetical protein IKK37_04630 [Clostridia bacterium]|nr:hypothetical protein [Clostridia bacterium]
MKKFIALLTALGLLLSFAACGKSDQNTEPATNVTQMNDDEINQLENELFGTTAPPTEATTAPGETVTEENSSTEEATTVTSDETTTAAPSNALSDNPAEWSKEQIVKYYKLAAAKSSNVTSKKTMVMKELVVNEGDGLLAKFVDMATPLFKDALAKNSTEFMGITGGYGNLVPSDVKTAKAYKSGNYTVIEMTMVEQVDGAHGKEKEGTVGHAISVVGDLAVIEENLPMFDIDFENSETKIKYANPTVKVKINNQTHQIEKGTWSYDVNVDIKNLYIKNLRLPIEVTIKSGRGSVEFNVTVGGGF